MEKNSVTLHVFAIVLLEKSYQKLVLRVLSWVSKHLKTKLLVIPMKEFASGEAFMAPKLPLLSVKVLFSTG